MGADLVIAMVLSALITHAWEQSKRRSAAAWEEARQRAAQRWERRTERMRSARRIGPKDPLWWVFATGWVLAAVTAASVASVGGLCTGAIVGARSGYRVGREGAQHRWGYRETWRQWRSRREFIETEECQRCGGTVPTEQIVIVPELGRVCLDCRPSRKPREPGNDDSSDDVTVRACRSCGIETDVSLIDEHGFCVSCGPAGDAYCDGQCTNSDMSPDDAEDEGKCGDCAGRGEFVSNFGGKHRHTRCHRCRGNGRFRWSSAQDAGASGEEADEPDLIYVHPERADVNETENPNQLKGTPMSELVPANASGIAATGEGYADTINTLSALSMLLNKAYDEVQGLGDQLTTNSLDADTINQINELTDVLESAAPLAANLHKHVEQRHAPVADAVAGAGGSSNIATKSWYDQY